MDRKNMIKLTGRDKEILMYVELCKRYIYSQKSPKREEWLDKATLFVCSKYNLIKEKNSPEAYIIACIKWLNPIYAKERVEVQVPVSKEGESLEDLFFVDNRNPESKLTEEPKEESFRTKLNDTKELIKRLKQVGSGRPLCLNKFFRRRTGKDKDKKRHFIMKDAYKCENYQI